MWPGALSAITGRSRRWITGRLRDLEEREFLQGAADSSVEGEPEYRFRHVLIRDVAYNEIPRRRRGDVHRKTAEWLETLSPDRASDRAEMLAHHLQCAYELTRAAGADASELAEPARLAMRDAGDRALSLNAFPAAARFFRAALALWPAGDRERPSLLFLLGKSMYYEQTAGADELAEARDALLAAGDRETAAEAEAFLAYLAHHHGLRDQYFAHLDEAAALVSDLGPSRAKAEVLVDLANHLAMARNHERTIATATEALEIARALRLRELEASALAMIGVSRGLSGDLGGRDDLERAIAITEGLESHLSAHCCGMLADLECQMGDLESAFALQARARLHAERFGHAGFVRWLAAERVGEGYWTGEWDAALALADNFIAESETGTPNFMEGYCRAMRGHIRLARGDGAGALDDAARAVAFARSAEDPQTLYPAMAFAARAEVMTGSLDDGALLAEELLGRWRANRDAYPASAWAVDLAYALDALGRGAELLEHTRFVASKTRWLEAVICFLGDDFDRAAAHFRAIGSRPDEAAVYLRAAHRLFQVGRQREGRAAVTHALAFYRPVAATTYLREAQVLAGPEFVTKVSST